MTDRGTGATCSAPAKINLYLHVVGRRDDGYHELDSLIVFAGCGDEIAVEPAEDLSLRLTGPFAPAIPADSDNLVLRAARALADAAGIDARTAIHLDKRLPVAAGIGGGSADAAAVLRALDRLWGVDAADDLVRIGLALGADVPVCLSGTPAFVGGIGERIDPAPPLPPCWLVLANPGVEVPTPEVFARRSGSFSRPARFDEAPDSLPEFAALLADRRNDLETPARSLAPVIGEVLDALGRQAGALLARMSGSGATCFALFADEAQAAAAARALAATYPNWWVAAAAALGGGAYTKLH